MLEKHDDNIEDDGQLIFPWAKPAKKKKEKQTEPRPDVCDQVRAVLQQADPKQRYPRGEKEMCKLLDIRQDGLEAVHAREGSLNKGSGYCYTKARFDSDGTTKRSEAGGVYFMINWVGNIDLSVQATIKKNCRRMKRMDMYEDMLRYLQVTE